MQKFKPVLSVIERFGPAFSLGFVIGSLFALLMNHQLNAQAAVHTAPKAAAEAAPSK